MKTMKIYGMNGLLEWHGTVHSNGIKMKVDFTNGTTTAYGVAPATFITKDALTQHIMENSDEFKNGRIFLVRSVELPNEKDDAKIASPAPKAEGAVLDPTPEAEEVSGEISASVAEEEVVDNGNVVKVADKSEAIEWLKEHYPEKGYTGVKLRAKAAFDEACKECGVVFDFA